MDFLTLNLKGALLALVFAAILLYLGGELGIYFLLAMLLFLVFSALATYIGYKNKEGIGLGQKPRGIANVLANGIPPLIMAFLFYIFYNHSSTLALLSAIGFLASVAAITSDKFSSEIGVLGDVPRMIFTFEKVKKGTSGGVTWFGTFMGLVGAIAIGLIVLLVAKPLSSFTSTYSFTIAKGFASVVVGGFVGGIVDSVLGYYEEKGIGNKYTSNFVCGIVGGLFAMLLFIII